MLSDLQTLPTATTGQFGYAQAEGAPGESAADLLSLESESAPSDQFFEEPAGAPADCARCRFAADCIAAAPLGTSVLRFVVPETQIAQGGSGVVSDAQMRASDQADAANNGIAASAPMLQATIVSPEITLIAGGDRDAEAERHTGGDAAATAPPRSLNRLPAAKRPSASA